MSYPERVKPVGALVAAKIDVAASNAAVQAWVVMRSEHKTTADEYDAFTGWRHVIARVQRVGVRKAIKRRSHRKDRRQARRRLAAAERD